MISTISIDRAGSKLVTSMWKAWDTIKLDWTPSKSFYTNYLCFLHDSPWFGNFAHRLKDKPSRKAHKCHKAGITKWKDLIMNGLPKAVDDIQVEFNIFARDATWCISRLEKLFSQVQARYNFPANKLSLVKSCNLQAIQIQGRR